MPTPAPTAPVEDDEDTAPKRTDLPVTDLVEHDKRKWDGGNAEGMAWANAMKAATPDKGKKDDPPTGNADPDDDGDDDPDLTPLEDAPEPAEGEVENSDGAPVAYSFAADGTLVPNVFCATGEGGGVDPTCSTGGVSLSPEQAKSVASYKNAGYGFVNRGLRGNNLDDRDKPTVSHLDALMNASKTTTPITVHRGYGSRMLITDNGFPADPKPGDSFTDKAFVSTTTDKKKAMKWSPGDGDVTATIHVPVGVGAAHMDRHVTQQAEEGEVLLERGLTYRVKARTPKAGGGYHLEMEVVPPGTDTAPKKKKGKTQTNADYYDELMRDSIRKQMDAYGRGDDAGAAKHLKDAQRYQSKSEAHRKGRGKV